MMMTTTSSAAISESARSNFFDLRVSVLSSIGDMTQSPSTRLFRGPAPSRQNHPVTVRGALEQAGLFERVGSLRTGRQLARFLKGVYRNCIPRVAAG
jgi:hypothetical protein